LIAWAEQTGPATGRLAAGILERRPHPEQGYRACLRLMRLGRVYGADRQGGHHRARGDAFVRAALSISSARRASSSKTDGLA
jgi:hypothetical protein